jgi:hypothetical protein
MFFITRRWNSKRLEEPGHDPYRRPAVATEKWLWQWRTEFGSICLKEQIHILHRSSQNLLESQQLGLCGTQQFEVLNPFSIWGERSNFQAPSKVHQLPIDMGKLANILRITVQSSTAFQATLNPK